MFKSSNILFNRLNLKLAFVLTLFFIITFYVIDIFNHLAIFSSNSLESVFLSTFILFALSLLLILTVNKITKPKNNKQMQITKIFDCLEEEVSVLNPETLTFTYLNRKLLNDTQYGINELLGQHIIKISPDCEQAKMQEFIKPLIAKEIDELKYKTLMLKKDGSKYPVKVILKYSEDINALIVFNYDMIEEKLTECIPPQFLSTIGHELRTPLTAITGAVKIILGELVGEVPAPMKEMVKVISNNATRLLELVNDLADMEKLKLKYKLGFETKSTNND